MAGFFRWLISPILRLLRWIGGGRGSESPPSVRIISPTAGVLEAPVAVRYLLVDAESDLLRVEVAYSTDEGATFGPATEAVDSRSEGVIELSSSPSGETHLFVWDATADLPTPQTTGVLLRVQAFDGRPGAVATAGPFDFWVNTPPSVRFSYPSMAGSMVLLRYVLTDPDSNPVDIEVSYSPDGGKTYLPVTEAREAGSEGVTGLSSSPTGQDHALVWNAEADLQTTKAAGLLVRIRTFDPDVGGADVLGPLDIQMDSASAPSLRFRM